MIDKREIWQKRGKVTAAAALAVAAPAIALAMIAGGPLLVSSPAHSEAVSQKLPPVPANGVLGFVVEDFHQPVVRDGVSCPEGTALRLRDRYLVSLPAAERERLSRKENEKELDKLWQTHAFGPGDTNICTNPDMFDRPLIRTVQSPLAMGLNLDDGGGNDCAQDDFTSPTGQTGIDNQEYRVMGCTREWRGVDGSKGDMETGLRQFFVSGEWTQVIIVRGIDSFVRDDDVEVVYANTPDRPYVDNDGKFLTGATFTVSDTAPRHRNVLKGKIVNGVLTTEPKDIKLTQTWGQGGARDIRGNRSIWDYRQGRLRMTFQPDGTLSGLLGGYRPVFDVIVSPALGGAGSALVAGIDCAGELATLKKYADGLRNPKTGQCEGVSSAQQITAIPAYVNDVGVRIQTSSR